MSQPTTFGSPTGTMYDPPPGGGGGGSGVEVLDEGIIVLADATALNFIGSAVTATDAGGGVADITVVLPPAFDPNECPVIIGDLATAGNGSTPDDVTLGEASALAIGCGAQALTVSSSAVGNDAIVHDGLGAVAVGLNAQVGLPNNAGDGSVAVGRASSAGDNSATAVGDGATAQAFSSVAVGVGASVIGNNGTAIGREAACNNFDSIAAGLFATADGQRTTAVGHSAHAVSNHSVAVGNAPVVNGVSAIGIGDAALTANDDDIAIGRAASATNLGSVSIGAASTATGTINGDGDIGHSLAVGPTATADLAGDVAVGWGAHASGGLGVAVGKNATVGVECVGIGHAPVATGSTATAIGDTANALGDDSISIGSQSAAHPTHGIAIGPVAVVAVGHDASVALGFNAQTDRANQIMLGEGQVVDIPSAGNGLALRSPNGTRFLLTVSNAGALVITATP